MNTSTFTRSILAVTLAATLTLTGCATISGQISGQNSTNTSAGLTGAGLGCAAGAVVGKLIHSNMLGGCAVGAAAGAVGAIALHRHEVAEARKLADEAKAAGANATVNTTTEQVPDTDGVKKPTEVMTSLDIDPIAADVDAHGSASADLIAKTAHMADASSDPITIAVQGTKRQRQWIDSQLQTDLKADTKTTVKDEPASTPHLVLTPVPNVAG